MPLLREAVRTHGIPCDWNEAGKIHAAATDRGASKLKAYAKSLDLLDVEYDWLDANRVKEITGSDFYISGPYAPGTILVQPAALVRGLAKTLPGNVTLFENSPVTAMELGAPHWLNLPGATVQARILILANNGFAGQFGYYRKELLPVAT